MSDPFLLPVRVTRTFPDQSPAAILSTDLDVYKARPGFSPALGGPTLSGSHETNDSREIPPIRLRFQDAGDIVLRYLVAYTSDTNTAITYDDTITGAAGEVMDLGRSLRTIVASGTSAPFTLGWP